MTLKNSLDSLRLLLLEEEVDENTLSVIPPHYKPIDRIYVEKIYVLGMYSDEQERYFVVVMVTDENINDVSKTHILGEYMPRTEDWFILDRKGLDLSNDEDKVNGLRLSFVMKKNNIFKAYYLKKDIAIS